MAALLCTLCARLVVRRQADDTPLFDKEKPRGTRSTRAMVCRCEKLAVLLVNTPVTLRGILGVLQYIVVALQ